MGEINFAFDQPIKAKNTALKLAGILDTWCEDRADRGEDCNVKDILFKPFASGNTKEEKVMEYLEKLTPHNCYIVHRDKQYQNLPDLKTEVIYNSQYSL